MDGLTKPERQSYMTLWSIAKSPLYSGDDLTELDAYGVSLLTNREVLRVNQQPGAPGSSDAGSLSRTAAAWPLLTGHAAAGNAASAAQAPLASLATCAARRTRSGRIGSSR